MAGIRDLFFRISAKDDTASAFAAVRKNMAGVEGAARSLRERVNGSAKSMRNIGAMLTATVTLPLIAAARASIGAFAEQEKSEAQVAQAVRQTGGAAGLSTLALLDAAAALQDLTSRTDASILRDVTAQLLTFGNVSGDVFKRAQLAALDLATALGSDLKAQTIQLGKALNDPVRGMSALDKAGVQFSGAQRDLITTLARSGRTAKSQGLILDEIAKFYGGQAAAAAATLDGQIAGLSADWRDLMESFGATGGDVLAPLIAGARDVIAALAQAPEPVKRFIVAAGAVAAAAGPVIAAAGLLGLALGAVAAPVAVIVAGLAVAGAGMVALWPDIEARAAQLRAALAGVASGFRAAMARSVAAVRRLVADVFAVIRAGFDSVAATAQHIAAQVAGAFDRLYERVVGNSSVPDMVDAALQGMGALRENGVRSATDAASVVEAGVRSIGDALAAQLASAGRGGGFDLRTIAGSFVGAIATGAVASLSDAAIGALAPAPVIAGAGGADFTIGRGAMRPTDIPPRQTLRAPPAPQAAPQAAPMAQPLRLDVSATVNVTVNTESPAAFFAASPMIGREIKGAMRRAATVH